MLGFVVLPAAAQYGGGAGTADDPYLIFTAGQLVAAGRSAADVDKHFRLEADIDLAAHGPLESGIFGTPDVGAFTGVFDGNGKIIANLQVQTPYGSYLGLFGLVRGARRLVPTFVVRLEDYEGIDDFSRAITALLNRYGVDLVLMAGFLKLYRIPSRYEGRVMNIHPALIPKYCGAGFYGHHVHEAVIEAGEQESGCTVHFADNEYDHGPIVLQRAVPVRYGDSPEEVQRRVFREECIAYPEAIRLFAAGRLEIDGRRVRIRD